MITTKNREFLLKFGPDEVREEHLKSDNIEYTPILNSPFLSDRHKEMVVNKSPHGLRYVVKYTKNPSEEHVKKFLNSESDAIGSMYDVIANDNTSSNNLGHAIDSKGFQDMNAATNIIQHPNFNSHLLGRMLSQPKKHEAILSSMAYRANNTVKKLVTDDHIMTLIKHIGGQDVDHKPSLLSSVIRDKYSDGDDASYQKKHVKNVPPHIMDAMLTSPSAALRASGSSFINSLKDHHIDMIIKGGGEHDISNVMESNIIKDHHLLDIAKNHQHSWVRIGAKRRLKERHGEDYGSFMKFHGAEE